MSRERQFSWADPQTPQTLLRGADGKAGLAFLTAILKGELPAAPIAVALGFKLVHAEGRVVHRGQRAATAEAKLTDAAGKLYAHATTTCLIMPRK